MAYRYDRGGLRKPKLLANGSLRVDAYLTRSGVLKYVEPDGTERFEYRPPAEVHKAESMDTLAMVSFTNNHPPQMLTTETARKYAVGTVGENIRTDGDHLAAAIVIFDAATIKDIQSGKVEVSCGYEAEMIEIPGVTPQGERYDAIQTNIVYNHVALEHRGRAGTARIRTDAAEQIPHKDSNMDPEELKRQLDAATKRADKLEGERDSLQARCDRLETEARTRTDSAAQVPALVTARVKLVMDATKLLPAETQLHALSDTDIKLAVIKHCDGAELPKDKAEKPGYVDARYDMIVERSDKATAARTDTAIVIASGAQLNMDAGAVPNEAEMQRKMNERAGKRYKVEA